MGLLKEKTRYRPCRSEVVLAWIFTVLAVAAVAADVLLRLWREL